jgi:magnesium-transporting ATPase (P-type)
MEDEIRDGVQDAINKFYYAQTNIRVLSGDHKDTVVNLAVNLQIIEHNNEAGVMAGDYLTH